MLLMKLSEITDADKRMNHHLGSNPVDTRIHINPEIRI